MKNYLLSLSHEGGVIGRSPVLCMYFTLLYLCYARCVLNRCIHHTINGHLTILKKLKCLQLKKEMNTEKDCVRMSHNV